MVELLTTETIWYSLFWFYLMAAVTISALVFGFMTFVVLRYRTKSRNPAPSDPIDEDFRLGVSPKRGGVIPVLVIVGGLAVLFFGLTLSTFYANEVMEDVSHSGDPAPLKIRVEGYQWGWIFVYPNGKKLDGELIVPVGKAVQLEITSRDVYHAFKAPDFKIMKDAIPGRLNYAWFRAVEEGEYHVQCYELCGVGHARMIAKIKAVDPGTFQNWYTS